MHADFQGKINATGKRVLGLREFSTRIERDGIDQPGLNHAVRLFGVGSQLRGNFLLVLLARAGRYVVRPNEVHHELEIFRIISIVV